MVGEAIFFKNQNVIFFFVIVVPEISSSKLLARYLLIFNRPW